MLCLALLFALAGACLVSSSSWAQGGAAPTSKSELPDAALEAPPEDLESEAPQPLRSSSAAEDGEASQALESGDEPVAWWQVWRSFSGEERGFMRRALAAGVLAALACGFLGLYVVLKRIVFVGVALAELSSAGVALALLAGFAPLLGSVALTLAGVALFSARGTSRRLPHETSIGILYATSGALAILLIAGAAHGETHMLKLLQGDVLAVDAGETWQMALAFVLVGALHALAGKEFTLVSFDPDEASALGLRTGLWSFLLFATIGTAIAFSIRAVGVLLTTALLVLPPATALLTCSRLRQAMWTAPLLAASTVVLGLHLSFVLDAPASAVTVALAFVLLAPVAAYEYFARRS
jgi:ABC-type Mn2+/Zn2+ transport system permease subunit